MTPKMWTSREADDKFRAGLMREISKGYMCGLCMYFSRYDLWGYCVNFFSEWRDQHLHEEFSCKHFLLSPEFQTYKREHPSQCQGGCKL